MFFQCLQCYKVFFFENLWLLYKLCYFLTLEIYENFKIKVFNFYYIVWFYFKSFHYKFNFI